MGSIIVVGRRRLVPALWLAAFLTPAAAQDAHDGQLWLNTTLFGSVGSFSYFAEVQPRFADGISRRDQLILRPAVGWKFDESLSVYQGYARVESTPAGGPAFSEDRSFQQVSWEMGKVAGGKLSSRTRFEQRWQSDGRDTGFRLREMLRYAHPLTDGKSGIAAVGWTEVFVALNDTDWGARAGFDRVRIFVGLELPLAGQSTIEVGYINQTVDTPGPGIGMDHIVSLNLFLRH